jgi:hypothetical protein
MQQAHPIYRMSTPSVDMRHRANSAVFIIQFTAWKIKRRLTAVGIVMSA